MHDITRKRICALLEKKKKIRKAIHIRKEQDKSMNREEGSYQLPHIYDYLL